MAIAAEYLTICVGWLAIGFARLVVNEGMVILVLHSRDQLAINDLDAVKKE